MKLINYICRFPFALFLTFILMIVFIIGFTIELLFFNWDHGVQNFCEMPEDLWITLLSLIGLKKEKITIW